MSDDAMLAATKFGDQYEVLEKLGSGGMGTVYKARDKRLDSLVAIKVVSDTAGGDSKAVRRLQNEAQALATLQHPNIVRVMSMYQLDGDQFALVMEYIDGKDLAAIIEQEGKLAPERCRALLTGCAEGLSAAHKTGIIHRDLKPSNIIVISENMQETVKILDFGIAKIVDAATQKLTRTGAVIGTPAYMSPEQAIASPLDARSDIYSLGCVFYQAMTGKQPYEGESAFEVLLKHANENIRAIDCAQDKRLADIIAKCTERDPSQRFQSAEEILQALGSTEFSHQPSSIAVPVVKPAKQQSAIPMFCIAAAVIAAFSVKFIMDQQRTVHDTSAISTEQSDSTVASRLLEKATELKKKGLHLEPEELSQLRRLDNQFNSIAKFKDIANAYSFNGDEDRAQEFRVKVVEAEWNVKERSNDFEVQKIVLYLLHKGDVKNARKRLDDEMQFERGKSEPQPIHIAKTQLDLMAFGLLTGDENLVREMREAFKASMRDEQVRMAIGRYTLPEPGDDGKPYIKDRLYAAAHSKDPHFAADLLGDAAAPPTVR